MGDCLFESFVPTYIPTFSIPYRSLLWPSDWGFIPIYETCKVSKIEYWYMKLGINSEDVGSYFAKAWFSIENAGNANL
jgi:hypothetical protein